MVPVIGNQNTVYNFGVKGLVKVLRNGEERKEEGKRWLKKHQSPITKHQRNPK
jgi:hypothetical protein